jgi:hypothetical protein
MRHLAVVGVLCVFASTVSWAQVDGTTHEPLFDQDVMAVLSRAGCNAGACHGNQNGKGGFRLSLRGEDPDFDYTSLVRGEGGRRVNPVAPQESLLLRKPSMALPHEGGLRLPVDSLEYKILRDWIAAGMPRVRTAEVVAIHVQPQYAVYGPHQSTVQVTVEAERADGSRRTVTHLAVYEVVEGPASVEPTGRLVREGDGEVLLVVRYLRHQVPVRLIFLPHEPSPSRDVRPPELSGDRSHNYSSDNSYDYSGGNSYNYIDTHVESKLRLFGVEPSPISDDATFVRRVYLDVLGVLPTAEEARAFCVDPSPDKRSALVDRLLARPEFAEFWALKWSDLLRVEEKTLDTRGVDLFYEWLRQCMAEDRPWNEWLQEMITARGSTYQVPAANFYRAHRDPFIRGETVARLFLGVRLQCARCHNHPFDRWTQDDYYAWASCFEGIDYEILQNDRRDKFDQHEFVGEQVVKVKADGLATNPRTGQQVLPRLLGENWSFNPSESDRYEVVAQWMTSPSNPWFARVMANWIFYHLMGKALVEPVDDFRLTNPPTHPELLDALAADFVEQGFRLKPLVRRIVLSSTYQRSAERLPGQPQEDRLFARAVVRRLTAEQLLDATAQTLDVPLQFAGYPAQTRAGQVRGVRRVREREQRPTADDRFLRNFGKPERLLACECERSNEVSLKQVFTLVGQDLQARLKDSPKIAHWAAQVGAEEAAVEDLFWTALSRPPTQEEKTHLVGYITSMADRRSAWEDVTWAVVTSREFLFRH